jgi:WD40 repeat protein
LNDNNQIQTGEQLRIISHFEEPPTCVWAPDGQTFVTGCLYIQRNLCQWNVKGELVYDWGRSHRIQDLAMSPDGNRLVAMGADHHIHIYNFVTRELEYEMDLKVKLCSVSISKDSLFLLVSKNDGEARIFNLETRESVKKFVGPKGGPDVFRSNFGGANESFITSGSHGMLLNLSSTSCRSYMTNFNRWSSIHLAHEWIPR